MVRRILVLVHPYSSTTLCPGLGRWGEWEREGGRGDVRLGVQSYDLLHSFGIQHPSAPPSCSVMDRFCRVTAPWLLLESRRPFRLIGADAIEMNTATVPGKGSEQLKNKWPLETSDWFLAVPIFSFFLSLYFFFSYPTPLPSSLFLLLSCVFSFFFFFSFFGGEHS